MEQYIWLALTTLASAFVGSYLAGYLKKKGENLATHEDISKLVDQVRAVTQATKEIESKISIDMWSKQQRWEVQKTALLDSLKELASAEAALWALVHTFSKNNHETEEGKQYRKEANEKYADSLNAFWRTKLATEVVCGRQIADQLQKLDHLFFGVRNRVSQGEFGEIWANNFKEVQMAKRELGELIRKNLDFGPELGELTLPPIGSSAAPTPGSPTPESAKP